LTAATAAPGEVREPAERALPPPGVLGGVRADPDVHVVDDDLTGTVHDQVDVADRTLHDQPRGLLDIERDPRATGEVVAGAEREQADHRVGELVATVQRGDDRVQAAVTAGYDDPSATAAVQDAVQLARAAGRGHLDVGGAAQHGERRVEALLVVAPGLGVGDQQDRLHAWESTPDRTARVLHRPGGLCYRSVARAPVHLHAGACVILWPSSSRPAFPT
jgi:hypothetical protein